MLPDLRIVIAAVLSTFVFTVGVGFFASSRLIHEQMMARLDTKGFEDTPINRIALNWPEPTKIERNMDLDFAISAKGSGNPVRDISSDVEQQQAQKPKSEQLSVAVVVPLTPTPALSPSTMHSPAEMSSPPIEASAQAAEAPAQRPSEDRLSEPEPTITVAKAPESAPEMGPTVVSTPELPSDTHVIVRPADVPPIEVTGSIPAPIIDVPQIPVPEPRPKVALRTDVAGATEVGKRAVSGAAQAPAATRKRQRSATPRQRTVVRTPASQAPQPQPFDFFGLFRPPASGGQLQVSPQVSVPAAPPIN